MFNVNAQKNQLTNSFWLSKVKEASDAFYPRRKIKRMRLFTLTDGINFNEISKFEEERLIQRADVVAWVISDFTKRMRLEVESVGFIVEGDILTEFIIDSQCEFQNYFPVDIINLDFSSQDLQMQNGRIENEIICLEKHINLQCNRGCDKFVIIYTTVLNSHSVNKNEIIRLSDAIQFDGWTGLSIPNFTDHITDLNQQKVFIKETLCKLHQKYGYSNISLDDSSQSISGTSEELFTVVGIIRR